jgi:hypothetical protein
MGWMIIITLLIFYALGTAVHTPSAQVLPGVALLVLVADRWLVWKYSQRNGDSSQR